MCFPILSLRATSDSGDMRFSLRKVNLSCTPNASQHNTSLVRRAFSCVPHLTRQAKEATSICGPQHKITAANEPRCTRPARRQADKLHRECPKRKCWTPSITSSQLIYLLIGCPDLHTTSIIIHDVKSHQTSRCHKPLQHNDLQAPGRIFLPSRFMLARRSLPMRKLSL